MTDDSRTVDSAPPVAVPWYMAAILAVVAVLSAILATVHIGGGGVAAGLTGAIWVLPPALYIVVGGVTWIGVRSTDPVDHQRARQRLYGLALVLAVLSAVMTPARLPNWDVLVLVVTTVVSSAGAAMIAMIVFPGPARRR